MNDKIKAVYYLGLFVYPKNRALGGCGMTSVRFILSSWFCDFAKDYGVTFFRDISKNERRIVWGKIARELKNDNSTRSTSRV